MYKNYFKVLYLFAIRIVGDASSAEDIVQDVFTECWMKRNSLDLSRSLKPYLYKLTYNRSLDFLKLSDNKRVTISDRFSLSDEIMYSAFTLDEQLYSDEIGKEISNCVAELPDKCKQVFLLSRHDDLKNREIAEKLNISIKTVEKHISKALQTIRDHLLKTGYLGALTCFFIKLFNGHIFYFF
ncbi:RNA polymerase sigma-70 factor [Proteiniphilum sp. UBA5463]|uniref:RNA polymerase sigma-70 factor n=1 Tax=Proteiniphilum sp. UBA5463 TaxID=1947281 RepID=UPI00257B4E95|nr:RNA polymerase sigma-70 factor [Proteiniphilum sp. UBA5463]